MNAICPRCEGEALREAPHGATTCPRCHGFFVPRNRMFELIATEWPDSDASALMPARDSVAPCPVDQTVMTRAHIELENGTTVTVDRCSSCLGAWFDSGEWHTLAGAHFFDQFDDIWTAEWRSRQRRRHDALEYQRHEREELGPDLYEKLVEIARLLRAHPRRSQALAFLREESSK